MKLQTAQRTISRSGNFPEASFKIAANAKAFEILSSKLYANPKLAIVRELSTNAYDAQVAAGNQDKAFVVHLPNTFEPFFSIRDYGTGLSPEDVEHIYTTYFASTRTDSNDFTGALGLGSKSPFSYTDQFTVTSYYNGTLYCYSAFKNENGEPTIALLHSDMTDELNGVEVKINVNQIDFTDFKENAEQVYRFFPVVPNFTGAQVQIEREMPIFENSTYGLYRHDGYNVRPLRAIMGNVCYHIDDGKFTHSIGHHGILSLNMAIGDCEIAASREELHYDAKTIANIQNAINASQKDISDKINANISASASLLDKIKNSHKYREVYYVTINQDRLQLKAKDQYTLCQIEVYRDQIRIEKYRDYISPGANSNYIFIVVDDLSLKPSQKARIRYWLKEQKHDRVYLAVIQDLKEFVAVFGEPTIALNDIPSPPQVARTQSIGPRGFIKRFTPSDRICSSWVTCDASSIQAANSIAVIRDNHRVLIGGQSYDPQLAGEIAKKLGYDNLYGISNRSYKNFCKKLNLLDLETEAIKYIKNYLATVDVFTRARFHYNFDQWKFPHQFLKAIKGLSKECDALISLSSTSPCDTAINTMLELFKLEMPPAPNFQELFQQKYGLLCNVDLNYTKKSDITEYIILKEKQNV